MEEIRQLQRSLNERVLERAEADPEWRRRFIEDQETAMGEIPEARQLREMYETSEAPTMPTPPPGEEYRQLRRSLSEKILDRASSDPTWKQQLLDEPATAMRTANFPEVQQLRQMSPEGEEAEVRGEHMHYGDTLDISDRNVPSFPNWTLYRWSCGQWWG